MKKGQQHTAEALAKMRVARVPAWRPVGMTISDLKDRVWCDFFIEFSARFWSFVEVTESDQCWIWRGQTRKGYGYFLLLGREVRATRIAILLTEGSIPDDKNACHRCDNPCCVNPSHLFLGTHQENMDDMAAKGRRAPALIGQDHKMAKLRDDDVREIKRLLSAGVSGAAIARQFNVTPSTIYWISSGRHWGHVK